MNGPLLMDQGWVLTLWGSARMSLESMVCCLECKNGRAQSQTSLFYRLLTLQTSLQANDHRQADRQKKPLVGARTCALPKNIVITGDNLRWTNLPIPRDLKDFNITVECGLNKLGKLDKAMNLVCLG